MFHNLVLVSRTAMASGGRRLHRPPGAPHGLPAVGRRRLDAVPPRRLPAGGVLTDAATRGLLAASLDAGGHHDTGVRELLTACMADPHAAALMAARLRGNHAVAPALAARLRELGHR